MSAEAMAELESAAPTPETDDVRIRAQKRLDNAIEKITPFSRVALVSLLDSSADKHRVRYFFRKAVDASSEQSASCKPLVVFFHGLGCSKYDFVGAVDRLQKTNVLAIDWPCTGILDPACFENNDAYLDALASENQRFDLDVMAELAFKAIPQILEDLGYDSVPPFILVGHSMGGKIATLYASAHPESVSALVNIEGHLHPSDPRMARKLVADLDKEIESLSSCHSPARRIDREARVVEPAFQRVQNHFLGSMPDSDAIAKWMQVMERMTSPRGFFAQARAIANEGQNNPERLWRLFVNLATSDAALASADMVCPMKILHIYGERNRELLMTSLDIYQNQSNCCIGIREISGCGHFPFFDNPAEFWMVLETWLFESGLLS